MKNSISLEIFQSRLKTSISLEIFNLDLQNSPQKIGGWWVARLKISISLENFKILKMFKIWALSVVGPETVVVGVSVRTVWWSKNSLPPPWKPKENNLSPRCPENCVGMSQTASGCFKSLCRNSSCSFFSPIIWQTCLRQLRSKDVWQGRRLHWKTPHANALAQLPTKSPTAIATKMPPKPCFSCQ